MPIDDLNGQALRVYILLMCLHQTEHHHPSYVVALKTLAFPVGFRLARVPSQTGYRVLVVLHACPSRLPSSCAAIGEPSGTRRGPMAGTAWS